MKNIFSLSVKYFYSKEQFKILLLLCALCFSRHSANAQDPVLPPSNLGLANIYDGIAGKPGFVYVNYSQAYQTKQFNDARGNKTDSDLKINSLLSMHQFIYLSPIKFLEANLGFTVLVPVVRISATSKSGTAPSFNPSLLGDPVVGTAIQWSDKKLFKKTFSHRAEFDTSLPLGSYDKSYAINPSAHLFTFSLYHAFTLLINEKISISGRNQFNYASKIIDSSEKPGAFYNGNYSVEYGITPKWHVEAAGYVLAQLTEDSFNGNDSYYQNNFAMTTTKQHVVGAGPGLVYFGNSGILIEAKVFFEMAAQNATQGTRPTLRLAIPF